MMFLKKSFKKELMDDFSLDDGRIDRALKELRTINRFLGGNSVSKKGLEYLIKETKTEFRILDVGGGGSDILFDLKNKYEHLKIYPVDLNKHSCHYQKKERNNNKIICADAFKLPVREKSFDIVHASLFLHHFSDEEISRLIRSFLVTSSRGVIINDLRRNILAFSGIKILSMIFSKSEFVKNDGPLSVRRAFTKKEFVKILSLTGVDNFIIKRMRSFRFLVIIPSSQND